MSLNKIAATARLKTRYNIGLVKKECGQLEREGKGKSSDKRKNRKRGIVDVETRWVARDSSSSSCRYRGKRYASKLFRREANAKENNQFRRFRLEEDRL